MVEKSGKHILFLTHYFPPEVNAPASRTYEHAKRWVKRGCNVTVITNNPNHPHGKLFPGYSNKLFTREKIDGITVIRVKTFFTPNIGFAKRIANHLFYATMALVASFKVRNVDVVIATSPQFFCGLAGALVSRIRRRPFILEVRDLWPDALIALGLIKDKRLIRLLRRVEKWMYFAAEKIVTVTQPLKYHIVGTGYPSRRIFTVENSVDLELFDMTVPRDKCEDFLTDKFVVSYVGTFGMAHGLEVALKAAKAIQDYPDIHLLLIGDGAERANVIRKAQELQLDNVTIMPLQPKRRVADLIARSDLGIVVMRNLPLFRTYIPAKMFEFLAMRKPLVLSTGNIEASKIVEEYECGIVIEAEDSLKLKEAILKLYLDEELRKKLGENGFRAVRRYYNREVMAEKMLRVIFPSREENVFASNLSSE